MPEKNNHPLFLCPSIEERLKKITDGNINKALTSMQGAFGLEEKQLKTADEKKLFHQLQAENLILWLKDTFDGYDDGTQADNIKARLNAMNNRVIEHYNAQARLEMINDKVVAKPVDEKAIPIKAREQLLQTKVNLLCYACSCFKIVAIPALLNSIRQQLGLFITPELANTVLLVTTYKSYVVDTYNSLVQQFRQHQNETNKEMIQQVNGFLEHELLTMQGDAILAPKTTTVNIGSSNAGIAGAANKYLALPEPAPRPKATL